MISCLLNIAKIWHSAQIKFSSTLNVYFRCNDIHREIDQWNRHQFGAKWTATVPNSVTPVKPIVCKWIYMSQCNVIKWHTHYMHVKCSSAFPLCKCDCRSFYENWNHIFTSPSDPSPLILSARLQSSFRRRHMIVVLSQITQLYVQPNSSLWFLTLCEEIHRSLVDSIHKRPVTRKVINLIPLTNIPFSSFDSSGAPVTYINYL